MKNRANGVEEKPGMFHQILHSHSNVIKALIGKGYSHATWVKYNTTRKQLTDFLKWEYNISDFNNRKLSFEFLADFEFYLQSEKNTDVNTNFKYIKNLKKIVKDCVAKNWLDKDTFMTFKVKN